jgi:predicted helicase
MLIDARNTWHTAATEAGYDDFIPLGTKEAKNTNTIEVETIFKNFSNGVKTNRDEWAYDFHATNLKAKIERFTETYNGEVDRWKRRNNDTTKIDDFVSYDDSRTKWSETLKSRVVRGEYTSADNTRIRPALYRPFCKRLLYYDRIVNERVYQMPVIFPLADSGSLDNVVMCVSAAGSIKAFHCLASNIVPDIHLTGDSQCFPFYTYNEDGSGRRENITEWALETFRGRYGEAVTKRDIFHYVYALLHHPEYRSRYAENLKRDLPRVPLVPDGETFRAFVAAGSALAALHLGYETAEPYPLTQIIAEGATAKSMFHVEKMKLTKDKAAVIVNPHLTLAGIPPEASRYRLGNRSALEWIVDQYQISTDARSGITSDPNRPDDPEYIVRLIGQVVAVSVATVGIVAG